MIGLFLIYWIGKSFYELAHEHDKSRWGFAILGVVSYYAGTMIAGVILALLSEAGIIGSIDNMNPIALSALGLPMGLLTCWLLYRLLKSQWSKRREEPDTEVIDRDLLR